MFLCGITKLHPSPHPHCYTTSIPLSLPLFDTQTHTYAETKQRMTAIFGEKTVLTGHGEEVEGDGRKRIQGCMRREKERKAVRTVGPPSSKHSVPTTRARARWNKGPSAPGASSCHRSQGQPAIVNGPTVGLCISHIEELGVCNCKPKAVLTRSLGARSVTRVPRPQQCHLN